MRPTPLGQLFHQTAIKNPKQAILSALTNGTQMELAYTECQKSHNQNKGHLLIKRVAWETDSTPLAQAKF